MLEGPQSFEYNPKPATCAVVSEALRSKVSLPERLAAKAKRLQGVREKSLKCMHLSESDDFVVTPRL